MYEVQRIVVEALCESIVVEEAAADALFTAGIEIAAIEARHARGKSKPRPRRTPPPGN